MLGVNQLDFINYTTALKGNYRKGVHKLEAILANPTHAAEFAANLGGVSVVLGVPIGKEDKNSEALLSLLLASSVAEDAAYTWLGQFYKFESWDGLLGDAGRCQEIMKDPLLWRAVKGSSMVIGKCIATFAGLDCSEYANMESVAASQEAMTAVAASSTAMEAVAASSTAMEAVINTPTALDAVVSSSTAMAAVAASDIAVEAITNSETASAAVMPDLESNPHMQPLYYYGNQYTDLTGGYVTSASNQIRAYIQNGYLEINSSAGTSGGGSVTGINFAKVGSGYTGFAVRYKRVATTHTADTTVSTSSGASVAIEFPKVAKDDFVLKTNESMASWEDFKASVGYDNTCYFYAICLVKPDDIAPISSLAGIAASSVADVLANSTQVFEHGAAVWHILKNCTGDFAAQAVKNSTFMDALNASPMKSLFTAHSLWQKYLKMAV